MSNSLVYAVNPNSQVIVVEDTLSFGNPVRRYGNNCNVIGGNAVVNGKGYYDISADMIGVASTAGIVTMTLYKDGSAIPGATVSQTVTDGSTVSLSTFAIIRNTCCCDSTITAVISGVPLAVSSASISVIKE